MRLPPDFSGSEVGTITAALQRRGQCGFKTLQILTPECTCLALIAGDKPADVALVRLTMCEYRPLAGEPRSVRLPQSLERQRNRPAIERDVVMRPHQAVLLIRETDECRGHQRRAIQIEPCSALPFQEFREAHLLFRRLDS